MKFNKFYFENFDSGSIPFDDNNPRYVLSLKGVDEILSVIAEGKPFVHSIDEFDEDLVRRLINIEVIALRGNKLRMNVPFFLNKDLKSINQLSNEAATIITDKLIKEKKELVHIVEKLNNSFSAELNLYHLLGGQVFDGKMFDYLEENKLVTTSKIHPSGLDYLIILYEGSEELNEYSDKLLCSYNRYRSNKGCFSSFGDSNGNRKDFYRYERRKELNQLSDEEKQMIDFSREEVISKFIDYIDGRNVEDKYIKIFKYFGYVKQNAVAVPVYDSYADNVVNELYNFVINLCSKEIGQALVEVKNSGLSCINHEVNINDIANEVYHIIFGTVNELLVKNKVIAEPDYILGEGRYLKCFERK